MCIIWDSAWKRKQQKTKAVNIATQSSYQAFLSLQYQQVSRFHNSEDDFWFIAFCIKYLVKRILDSTQLE